VKGDGVIPEDEISGMAQGSVPPVFTIGHSTRSIPAFVELLRAGGVEQVVDIRKVPRSRANPQYNGDVMSSELAPFQIAYRRTQALGGLRRKSPVPPETNGLWRNQSFHNYADYALSEPFRLGLSELLDMAADRRTAIMCAEAVWWRCHRRIVADYLIRAGRRVFHLMGEKQIVEAALTPGAQSCADGLHYPAEGAAKDQADKPAPSAGIPLCKHEREAAGENARRARARRGDTPPG
jgi:uncharacterized protein (DUF488 family)